MASTWVISLSLALLPLTSSLQYYFSSQEAYIPNNLFFGYEVVGFDTAKEWAESLLTFSPELHFATKETVFQIRNADSWRDLYSVVANATVADVLNTQRFIG